MSFLQRTCGIHGRMDLSPSSPDDFECLAERLRAVSATVLRLEGDDDEFCTVGFIEEWEIDGADDASALSASLAGDFRKVTFRITFGQGIAERLGSEDPRTLIERAFAVAALGESGVVVCHVADLGPNGQIRLPELH